MCGGVNYVRPNPKVDWNRFSAMDLTTGQMTPIDKTALAEQPRVEMAPGSDNATPRQETMLNPDTGKKETVNVLVQEQGKSATPAQQPQPAAKPAASTPNQSTSEMAAEVNMDAVRRRQATRGMDANSYLVLTLGSGSGRGTLGV